MKRHVTIRHEDIVRALREFQARGGIIHKLPDTATPRLAVVGTRYGQYENPRENLYLGGAYFSG
jgi:hypothetical protein